MSKSGFSLGYRSDIEGLRAIAVLLVVAAHAGMPLFPGGFIGVDVFFVLSGYLISGLLISQSVRQGQIKLLEFYLRRFLRLAPALLVMLVVVSVAARFTIAPPAQGEHFLSAATAALWLSNWHFWSSDLDYFSAELTQNLFLHTWSLSVEEQFYLVWPILIVSCFFLVSGNRQYFIKPLLTIGMLAVGMASFAYSFYATSKDPMAAYYLPMARAWQFSAGALALLYTYHLRGDMTSIRSTQVSLRAGGLHSFLGWIGLAAIILSSIYIRDTTNYPGIAAVVPTLGTSLLLISGASKTRLNVFRLLSVRPLVLVGMISYSLYLWHWPLLRLLEAFIPAPSVFSRSCTIILAFIAATLSFRLVESPLRKQQWMLSYPRTMSAVSLGLILLVAALALHFVSKNQSDAMAPGLDHFRSVRNDLPELYRSRCDTWTESAELTPCRFEAKASNGEVWLIGDSVAAQWFSAVSSVAKSRDWNLTVHTKSACPMVGIPYHYKRIRSVYAVCDRWRSELLEALEASQPDIVIMGSSNRYPFTQMEWENGTRSVLSRVAAGSGQVYILESTPYLTLNPMDCLANVAWRDFKLSHALLEGCDADPMPEPFEVFSTLASLSTQYNNVDAVSVFDLICPDNVCPARHFASANAGAATDFVYVFRDRHHLSDSFVKSLTTKLQSKLNLQ